MTVLQHKEKLTKQVSTQEITMDFFTVTVYDSVPNVLKLRETDMGKGVWIAGEYKTISAELTEINEDSYGVKINTPDKKVKGSRASHRTFHKNEVILHPDELTEERLEEFGFEVKDGRTSC